MAEKALNRLWGLKDSELQLELEQRGLKMETYNRKEAVALIQMHESKQVVVEGQDGSLKTAAEFAKAVTLNSENDPPPQLKLRRVIFHTRDENDLSYIFVGHNGLGFYIPREMEIEIPDYILNSCIKDAVGDHLFVEVDAQGKVSQKFRKVQRFPYTIVR